MDSNTRKEIDQIIDNELIKINKKITEINDFTSPIAPDDAIGRVSRMDAINNRSIFEASFRNLTNRKLQLEQIKNTVYEKDFGLCTKCRQSIPLERLKIKPEIRLCAGCLKISK